MCCKVKSKGIGRAPLPMRSVALLNRLALTHRVRHGAHALAPTQAPTPKPTQWRTSTARLGPKTQGILAVTRPSVGRRCQRRRRPQALRSEKIYIKEAPDALAALFDVRDCSARAATESDRGKRASLEPCKPPSLSLASRMISIDFPTKEPQSAEKPSAVERRAVARHCTPAT